MKYFNGFCLKNEKNLFKEYLEDNEFVVAGFSRGAQRAVEYVLNSKKRIDKLQLISPAFFNVNQKFIDLNINSFKKNKNQYIKNFLTKAGINEWKMENEKWKIDLKDIDINYACNEDELLKMFTFEWEKIDKIKNIKIEVFLGEFDKIISLKEAFNFFRNYATVYFIKKADHFLRS